MSTTTTKTSLQLALEEKASGKLGATKQEIAQAASVSTRTVHDVLTGKYATGPHPSSCTERQLRGYTEALTRLSLFAQISPEEALKDYGVDIARSQVRSWMERVRSRQSLQRGVSDPVLDAVQRRGVRAGILEWPPFVEDGQEVRASWAWRYVDRLVGALNPLLVVEPVAVDNINAAIQGILEGDYDFVFGIYDTPYRRFLGLDFVHLPGIGVPLGALATESAVNWSALLDDTKRREQRIQAIVIEKEVGHLFLAGACRFNEKHDLIVLRESDTLSLAAQYCVELLRSGSEGKRAALIADRLTCARVRRALHHLSSDWLKLVPSGLSDDNLVKKASQVELINDSHSAVPVYRLGLACRADAKRWSDLLRLAQADELFRNSLQITCERYIELLKQIDGELRPIDLEDLPPTSRRRFIEAVHDSLPLFAEQWEQAEKTLVKRADVQSVDNDK